MRGLLRRSSKTVLVAVAAAVFASAATATAAKLIVTSANIKNGTIQVIDISKKAQKKLKGNVGPQGPQGPAGANGSNGADGTARGYGLVNNTGAVAKLQKAKGITAVRRSGNGIFCLKGAGLDPNTLPMVLTQDFAGDVNGSNILLGTGSGPIISSQCNGDEFQAVVFDTNTGNGVNNVSFTFLIP